MHQPTENERQQIVREIFGEGLLSHANSPRFEAYFNHYCSVVCPASSGNAVIELDTPALRTHADVLSCVKIIINDPKISFNGFVAKAVDSKSTEASTREKEYVARVATDVSFAINCSPRDYSSDNFIDGSSNHVKWEGDVSFLRYIENAFGLGSQYVQPPEHRQRRTETMACKTSLKAWKLIKRHGIEIKGTNNLLEHLVLNPKTKTLKVFHQVSFLRAHLEKSRHEPLDLNFEESLRRGSLPPKLLLETLLTFHGVLFPITSVRDTKSLETLKAMIKKHGFDAQGTWIEFVRATPADMTFDFWGDRLSILYDIVKRPPPTNAMVAWTEAQRLPGVDFDGLEYHANYSAANYTDLVYKVLCDGTNLAGSFLLITLKRAGEGALSKGSSLATIRYVPDLGGVLKDSDTVELMEKAARAAYVKIPQGDDDEEAVRIREDRETTNDDSDQWPNTAKVKYYNACERVFPAVPHGATRPPTLTAKLRTTLISVKKTAQQGNAVIPFSSGSLVQAASRTPSPTPSRRDWPNCRPTDLYTISDMVTLQHPLRDAWPTTYLAPSLTGPWNACRRGIVGGRFIATANKKQHQMTLLVLAEVVAFTGLILQLCFRNMATTAAPHIKAIRQEPQVITQTVSLPSTTFTTHVTLGVAATDRPDPVVTSHHSNPNGLTDAQIGAIAGPDTRARSPS
ncbi:hypothetical protein NM208_g2257 [Fusarium decemcellulare]|uniref:Uncharacterized protein n=1 Tax=Fusarium decemcellulare TaxID=57161 RepID=A0ACC1STS1_9HYPO|nr:hypothetical protein NM208_g2257 [Fusarium decemcellulare]